jgi:hypothetical protein
MRKTAKGFWSYVHSDNTAAYDAIRKLAEHLSTEFSALTGGRELDLFRDTAQLKWGDEWRREIEKAVAEATFFIPIITPSYFASKECRKELLEFAEQAKEQNREGLLLPIYYIEVEAISKGDTSDPLVPLVTTPQWEDWRTLRHLDQTNQPYRMAVSKLAGRLKEISEGLGDGHGGPSGGGGAGGNDSDEDDSGENGEEEPADAEPEKSLSPPSPPPSADADLGGAEEAEEHLRTGNVEEMGLLELLVAGEEALPRAVETLSAIGGEIQVVGEGAQAARQEIQQSDAKGGGFKGRLVVANQLAKDLEGPASRLEQLGNEYVADLVIIDPAIRKMIELASAEAENPDDLNEFFEGIEGMATASEEGVREIAILISAMEESAQFSRELKAPLKQMRVSLQGLVDGHRVFEKWQEQIATARG